MYIRKYVPTYSTPKASWIFYGNPTAWYLPVGSNILIFRSHEFCLCLKCEYLPHLQLGTSVLPQVRVHTYTENLSRNHKRCALCPWVRLYRDGFPIIWHRFTKTKIWEASLSIHRLSWGGTNNLWACGFLRELDGWCFSGSYQVLAFHSGSSGSCPPTYPKET